MDDQNERRKAMFADMERSPMEVGVDGDPEVWGHRNWSSSDRLAEQEADGFIAEVLFPNTQPPFAPPAATAFEAPPYSDNFEHRWAGLRAHNRWVADFVSQAPKRRAGIAQVFLGDVEGSVKEIEWAAEHGLKGGVLIPGAPPDSPFEPLYSKSYEPIWAATAAAGLPLNHHAGGGSPNYGNHFPSSLAMFILEATWWTQRALWHLMFSGVFERYPNLKYVTTETGTAWVPETLEKLESFFHRMRYSKYGSETVFGSQAVADMSLTPSEYFARQCYIGASFLRPSEALLTRIGGHRPGHVGLRLPPYRGVAPPHPPAPAAHVRQPHRGGDHPHPHHQRRRGVRVRPGGAGPAGRAVLPHQGRGGHPHRLRRHTRAGQGLPGHEPPKSGPARGLSPRC